MIMDFHETALDDESVSSQSAFRGTRGVTDASWPEALIWHSLPELRPRLPRKASRNSEKHYRTVRFLAFFKVGARPDDASESDLSQVGRHSDGPTT